MSGKNKASLLALAALAGAAFGEGGMESGSAQNGAAAEPSAPAAVLLLLDDGYGANFMIEDDIPSILEQFRGFGWSLTTAAVRPEVRPCAWGSANAGQLPFRVDVTIGEIGDASRFDAIVLLPGKRHDSLLESPETRELLKRAAERGTVIAAWCRSSKVLARAGLLEGVHIVGRPEDREAFEAAGAIPAAVPSQAETPPPVSDRGIVTTLRSKFYRVAMCEEIRKTVEASTPRLALGRPAPSSQVRSLVVATFAQSGQEKEALIFAESLRAFGGSLKDAPVWILSPSAAPLRDGEARERLLNLGARILPFEGDPKVMGFALSIKVAGAAEAERLAEGMFDAVAWLDNDTVFLNEPSEFLLSSGVTIGSRPVHHRLIGSLYADELSPLWSLLYREEDVPTDNVYPMVTTIDRQTIRPYYNAGFLILRPERRILRTWYKELDRLIRNPEAESVYSRVPQGELFFHQAVLSSVILSHIPKDQIEELPFRYNYPLALHGRCPADLRPGFWNDLVTLRYDSMGRVRGTAWAVLPAREPLAAWLEEAFRK